jgi:hypothetical protein
MRNRFCLGIMNAEESEHTGNTGYKIRHKTRSRNFLNAREREGGHGTSLGTNALEPFLRQARCSRLLPRPTPEMISTLRECLSGVRKQVSPANPGLRIHRHEVCPPNPERRFHRTLHPQVQNPFSTSTFSEEPVHPVPSCPPLTPWWGCPLSIGPWSLVCSPWSVVRSP